MPPLKKTTIQILTTKGIRTIKILQSNLDNYKIDNRYKGKVYKSIKKIIDIKKKTDRFRSELTGLEGHRVTFRIRQDVLAKEPIQIIASLKKYYALTSFRFPAHSYLRFIITLVGVKQSTHRKERFGVSTHNQDRSKQSVDELWDSMQQELAKFYLEESPDWEYLTATRFVVRFSKRIDDA